MTLPQEPLPEIELLDSLRAEDEARHDLFFVPPPEFSRITGQGSVIVFGESGSGKTTLFKILQIIAKGAPGAPARLLVFWRPAPIPAEINQTTIAVQRLAAQLLDACGMALLSHIAQKPEIFEQAPGWAQERLAWFVKQSVKGNLTTRLGPLLEDTVLGQSTIQHIQVMQIVDVLSDPSPEQLIIELVSGLKRIGLDGIWVLSDGLEGWAEVAPEQLSRDLISFLSALSLFERSGLTFKFFLPDHLESDIIRASGVRRRRLDAYKLNWDVARLQKIVGKRLAAILNKETFTLTELCESPNLIGWLDRVGGNSPREWLDQVKPLIKYYSETTASSPISDETWKKLRLEHPPYFWMDETGQKVKVGGREVPLKDVPPKAYEMLRYLYQHSGQVVSKDELYYRVYLGLNFIPRPGDKDYEPPNSFAGLMDTNIYRIRQAIEPNPAEPVLLQTERGHGVKLVSRL